MSISQLNLETLINNFEKELKEWIRFLNFEIGLLTYLMGLACLGTSKPRFYAIISFIVVSLIMGITFSKFPKTLKELRLKAKEQQNLADNIISKNLDKFYIKNNLIKKCGLYWFGLFFLFFVASGSYRFIEKFISY
jgi:hypothetical protein